MHGATGSRTCFFERDPGITIARRAAAEGVGTLLLVLAAAGAGLAMARLPGGSPVLTLAVSAAAAAEAS
ncbi:hypothetical protein AC630_35545 [Bradyrhizobium sp. AS23.2]|nr:hypothetical protein AC630_35545 [Bradyrhizobium sp. AS23.2]